MELFPKITLIIVLIIIYLLLFKSKKNSFNVISRAHTLEILFQKERAIHVLVKSINEKYYDNSEKASIYKAIGLIYYRKRDYKTATNFFDKSIELALPLKFYYDKNWNHIIIAYIYSNQTEKAKNLYQNLLERYNYDHKFNRIKQVERYFEG